MLDVKTEVARIVVFTKLGKLSHDFPFVPPFDEIFIGLQPTSL